MTKDELNSLFDQAAAGYDKQWSNLSAINECLYLLLRSVFAEVRDDAKILCVGAGTGKEIVHLAGVFPSWQFVAVEPSEAMMAVCRQNIENAGIAGRCQFHQGYVDSLPQGESFDSATSFLVSQFILDQDERKSFFREIAGRLKPEGLLVNTDLSFDKDLDIYTDILAVWFRTMSSADMPAEALEKMKATYDRDVGILPPAAVGSMIASAGFGTPVNFFQAGLIHGWFAKRDN